MGIFSGIVLFIIIWWMVLFTVLPWGIRRSESPEEGHEPGAPSNPRIRLKFAVTSAIAAALWGGAYWAIEAGVFSVQTP